MELENGGWAQRRYWEMKWQYSCQGEVAATEMEGSGWLSFASTTKANPKAGGLCGKKV